ncbi:hypothetical protein [Mycobacterium sp.]|uniref:hypothetical protein n=1 Tax=Mycobacterium sp. TaxID=1785 RepID=UPI003F9C64A1
MGKGQRIRDVRQQKCVFCGAPADSKEHQWPDWLKESTVVERTAVNHMQHDGGSVPALIDGKPVILAHSRLRRHSGPPISKKLKIVCAPCNNGWMSRLEKATKQFLLPMIDGTPTTLDRHQQLILSRWADKMGVVAEFSSPENLISTLADRQRVMDEQDPNPALYTRVWIGSNGGDLGNAVQKHRSCRVADANNLKTGLRGGARTHLFAVGHVVLFVLGASIDFFDGYRPSELVNHEGKFLQIWPITEESVQWPPQEKLSAGEFELLGNSLTADSHSGKIPRARRPFVGRPHGHL